MSPRLAADYEQPVVTASRSALLELARTLRAYFPGIVLVGGWVPFLLIENQPRPGDRFTHVGSIDIDLVVDPASIGSDEYNTIVGLIGDVGWRPLSGSLFSFERAIECPDGLARKIKVDFLTPPASNQGSHRHRPIQRDLRARAMSEADFALAHSLEFSLSGTLPRGGETTVEIRMLDVVGCLGTKGVVLGERHKEKDAYDIVSVLDNYGPNIDYIASAVKPFERESLLVRALAVMSRSFETPSKEGSVWYADFRQPGSVEERARLRQRASQVVTEFIRLVSS